MLRSFFFLTLLAIGLGASAQTMATKKHIQSLVKQLRHSEEMSDSLKAIKVDSLANYFSDPLSRLYTAQQIKVIDIPELDQVIGRGLVDINTIADKSIEPAIYKYLHFKDAPYTIFMIRRAIRTSSAGLSDSPKEQYRKLLLLKIVENSPMVGIDELLYFYLHNESAMEIFRALWTEKEIISLANELLEDERYFFGFLTIVNKYKESISKPAAGFLNSIFYSKIIDAERKLYIYHIPRTHYTYQFPELYRGFDYLSALPENKRSGLLSPEQIVQVNQGNLFLSESALAVFPFETGSPISPALVSRYNAIAENWYKRIKPDYLGRPNFLTQPVSEGMLKGNSRPPYMGHALSFELLREHLVTQINIAGISLANSDAIVEDVMGQTALAYYALTIYKDTHPGLEITVERDPNEIIDSLWRVGQYSGGGNYNDTLLQNSDLSKIKKFFAKKKIKRIITKDRKFDLANYRVSEKVIIKRKWWFNYKYNYTADIPLRLRNDVLMNFKVFDVMNYSFLERDLEVNHSKYRPFNELIDVINNYPERSIPYLLTSLTTKNFPRKFAQIGIRNGVNSGSPDEMNQDIGLRYGQQPVSFETPSLEFIKNKVDASDVDEQIKKTFDSCFFKTDNINSKKNSINFVGPGMVDDQVEIIDRLYQNAAFHMGSFRLLRLQEEYANRLPPKPGCNFYEFLWCDSKANDKLNRIRLNAIVYSHQLAEQNLASLRKLEWFDLVSIKDPINLEPISIYYDTVNHKLMNVVKIYGLWGEKVIKAFADSVNNRELIHADAFWKKYDENYMQRYHIDLSNLSDHGFKYFVTLTNTFVSENMTSNTIPLRLYREGFVKPGFLLPRDNKNFIVDNEYTSNLKLEGLYLSPERDLIRKINSVDAVTPEGKTVLEEYSASTNEGLNRAIAADVSNLYDVYKKANEQWNEVIVYAGVTTGPYGQLVPVFMFQKGSVNFSFAISFTGQGFVIPLRYYMHLK